LVRQGRSRSERGETDGERRIEERLVGESVGKGWKTEGGKGGRSWVAIDTVFCKKRG